MHGAKIKIMNVRGQQCFKLVPSRDWISCVKGEAFWTYLSATNILSSMNIVWNVLSYIYNQLLNVNVCSTQKNVMGWFLSSLQRWWNSPNWYRLFNMPCLPRFSTTLKSDFKAFFPSWNRLRLPVTPFSLSLSRPTHKRQSSAHAWNRVHASRCHALARTLSTIGLNVIFVYKLPFWETCRCAAKPQPSLSKLKHLSPCLPAHPTLSPVICFSFTKIQKCS